MIDLRLVGQQVPEQPQGLHDNVDVLVRQQPEDLVRTQRGDNLNLYSLVRLECHVLELTKDPSGLPKRILTWHCSLNIVSPKKPHDNGISLAFSNEIKIIRLDPNGNKALNWRSQRPTT